MTKKCITVRDGGRDGKRGIEGGMERGMGGKEKEKIVN